MALPASDAFTDSNGVALSTHNAGWTVNVAGFEIQSNGAAGNGSGYQVARWSGDVFNDDHYSEGPLTVSGSGAYIGIAVRVDVGGANTYYGFIAASSGSIGEFFKMVASSWTQFGSNVPIASGSNMRLFCEGQDITLWDDGILAITQNDSAIAGGAPGLTAFNGGTTDFVDSWIGDNMAVPDPEPYFRVNRSSVPPSQRLA